VIDNRGASSDGIAKQACRGAAPVINAHLLSAEESPL
jgi:hypothetical protein